jgi:hypothetical protein
VIAEFFRSHDFDGLAYQSKFGQGHNLVLFDLGAANLVSCGIEEVKEIKFSFDPAGPTYFIKTHTLAGMHTASGRDARRHLV